MIKKTITYTDYEGEQRTEDFYFNLSKAELLEMDASADGGMEKQLNKIVASRNTKDLFGFFKDLILRSYGEKSMDGKRFIKSPELSKEFSQTEAFSEMVMSLLSDDKAATDFITGVIPSSLAKEVETYKKQNGGILPSTPAVLNG